MIEIYIWKSLGSSVNSEHASFRIDRQYCSWFTKTDTCDDGDVEDNVQLSQTVDDAQTDGDLAVGQNAVGQFANGDSADDPVEMESPEPNEDGEDSALDEMIGVETIEFAASYEQDLVRLNRQPDHTVRFVNLDESRIRRWWQRATQPSRRPGGLGQNCITTVVKALRAGGAPDYAGVDSANWKSDQLPWNAVDLWRYAHELTIGLQQLRCVHVGIRFVREHCSGADPLLIATASLNQSELVESLFRELSRSSDLVYVALWVLEQLRPADMDSIVEQLVFAVRRRNGLARVALSKDWELKSLLQRYVAPTVNGRYIGSRAYSNDFLRTLW